MSITQVERGELVKKATGLFWSKGFAGTSMQDLVEELGLHRASLYETFGSKERLFEEVVREYSDLIFETLFAPLGGDGPVPPDVSPRDRIETFLDECVRILCEGDHRGCLVVNSLLAHPVDLGRARDACLAYMEREERKLTEVARVGQERGEFRRDVPPVDMARMIRGALSGMGFASQIRREPEFLRPIATGLMHAIVA